MDVMLQVCCTLDFLGAADRARRSSWFTVMKSAAFVLLFLLHDFSVGNGDFSFDRQWLVPRHAGGLHCSAVGLRIHVDAYGGYRADERPRRFALDGVEYRI